MLVKGWRFISQMYSMENWPGPRVNVFLDPCLSRPRTFKPIIVPNHDMLHLKVSKLIHDSVVWYWNKINDLLWEVDRVEVNRFQRNLFW